MGNVGQVYKTILPAGDEVNYEAAYTEDQPAEGWINAGFDDSQWKKGLAPFGDNESIVKTKWLSKNIWMRRKFAVSDLNPPKGWKRLKLQYKRIEREKSK